MVILSLVFEYYLAFVSWFLVITGLLRRLQVIRYGVCVLFVYVFLFVGVVNADEQLRDSLFELQAQIQGYKTRIEESAGEIKTLAQTAELIEMRRKKILLEQALTRVSLDENGTQLTAAQRLVVEHAEHIARERAIIGQLLQDMQTQNARRLIQALSLASFSFFFDTVRASELVHNAVRESVRAVREEQKILELQKSRLQKKREELVLLHEVQVRQELALADEDTRKKSLRAYTGKRAAIFEELLHRSELTAGELQEEFFVQEGVGKKLSLSEAYVRAESAAKKLSIRTAFLVALLAQESHYGAQQGTGSWRKDMDPTQWPGFLTIVQRLGLDPDRAPVSKKPAYGWGGALGPTQFLPLTWLGYEEGIKTLTGHGLPSPWNIDDAFAGAALKLSEAGANAKTVSAERKAALMYFAGGNWKNPAFAFYADSILELAKEIEKELTLTVSSSQLTL